jgi:uncharacterized protein YqeY
MIIDKIKTDYFTAMKNKDSVGQKALSVVLSAYKNAQIEARFVDKTIGDLETISILQKQIKESNETLENFILVGNTNKITETKSILSILESYLPKMLSEEEVRSIIDELSIKNLGEIMKHFKANYNGKVDMQLVNKVAKSYIGV